MNPVRQDFHAANDPDDALDPLRGREGAGIDDRVAGPGLAPVALPHAGPETSHADTSTPRLTLPRVKIDAFVSSDPSAAAVESVARDRRAVRAEIALHRGGFAEAMTHYREAAPADLVVIEDSGSAEELEWRIEALAEFCPATTRLVVIGERNDIVLYRRLIRIGVSDYLVHPLAPLTLLDSVASIVMEEDEARDLGSVIAFIGVRGGVGSSTLAHNAAVILNRDVDAVTLLIDADIGFGTAALQFDVAPPQNLADALMEREDLDPGQLEKLTCWRSKRFGILAAPDRAEQLVAPAPGVMRHMIDQARRLARHVVLDLPHGWSPATVEALAAADHVVLVATPDLPSLRNARTLLGLIQKMRPNDAPAQLVLNRMPARGAPPVTRENFARVLDRTVTAVLPCEERAPAAEMSGQVLAEAAPECEMVRTIGALVAGMTGGAPGEERKAARRSLLGRLFSRGRR